VEKDNFKKVKIKVIGIGGGGVTIVKSIALKVDRVEFVATNTDSRSLEKMGSKVKPFIFGENITHGLGTGMSSDLGEKAAMDSKEKFSKILKNTDFCIFITCLGGGAGSGATPIFLETAKEMKVLTLTIATTPFQFEGSQKRKITRDALEKIQKQTDAISIISNESILKIIDSKTSFYKALDVVNSLLIENISSLINLVYNTGLINLDFADLKSILMKQDNLTYFQTKEFNLSKSVEEIGAEIVSNPLYSYDISKAKRILLNIEMTKKMPMQMAHSLSKEITRQNLQAKIIFGLNLGNKKNNKIKITLLATGCEDEKFKLKENHKNQKIQKKTQKDERKLEKKEEIDLEKKSKKKKQIDKKVEKKIVKVKVISTELGKNKKQIEQKPKKKKIIRKGPIEVKKEQEKFKKDFFSFDDELETPAFLRKKLK